MVTFAYRLHARPPYLSTGHKYSKHSLPFKPTDISGFYNCLPIIARDATRSRGVLPSIGHGSTPFPLLVSHLEHRSTDYRKYLVIESQDFEASMRIRTATSTEASALGYVMPRDYIIVICGQIIVMNLS